MQIVNIFFFLYVQFVICKQFVFSYKSGNGPVSQHIYLCQPVDAGYMSLLKIVSSQCFKINVSTHDTAGSCVCTTV